ncbi:MAG TPA: M56 family metallopeptidase, partial [Gemmatimonadales bacterium]|nr:M56 family metallopeptidase [Gemmatimonadales bacterium]
MMTQALGWALVDSLWQDALAAAGLAALFALLPVRAARTRYALATLTLALMLTLPLATAVRLSGTSPWTSDVVTATSPVAPGPELGPGPQAVPVAPTAAAPVAARIRAALEPALPWVVLVWFGGVVALSLRLASGWLVTRQLRSVGTSSVPDACREAVARLAARLRISRAVRVLESAVVQVPAVIGWLRPVVLLPASALTGLTPLQLDALLAHELAHVRRYDYLVNVIQSVIETLLFYHPAVWWVSQQVREEREHCCDDLAVAVCGDAHFYATALLGMERLRITPPGFALAAAGRGGSLMGRIRRLLAPVQTEIFPRW